MKTRTTTKGPRIVVEPGDSPWAITRAYIGAPLRWRELVLANPEKATTASGNFVSLVPGELLAIPGSWIEERGLPNEEAACMREDVQGLASDSPDTGAFPAGFTREDLAIVRGLAKAWGVTPDDLIVTWWAESGLQPHRIQPAGTNEYGGLIMGLTKPASIDQGQGWKTGTWRSIVTDKSIGVQLQAIAQIWERLFKTYLPHGESLAYFSERMGVSAASIIHALNFLPARVARLQTKMSPITKSTDHDPGTKSGSYYGDNAPLDFDRDGAITLADLDTQYRRQVSQLEELPQGQLLAEARKPTPAGETLASLLYRHADTWRELTGQSPYIPAGYSPKGSGGGDVVLLAVGALAAAWYARKRKWI